MVKNGDTVRVHYTGKFSDGKVFDSSLEREPLQFTLGTGSMIPGFEKAVNGMELGETKTVTIPAGEAYGPRNENLVMEVHRDQLPEGMSPSVGDRLQVQDAHGHTTVVTVCKTTDSAIFIDANHEMAGKDLTFEIELVEVVK
jgi:FKBP-type peptidyl-prolyl cis-trans isomerase 2